MDCFVASLLAMTVCGGALSSKLNAEWAEGVNASERVICGSGCFAKGSVQ